MTTMISANVTAMRTHVDEILSWEADIVMLQETRLTKVGQQVMIEASTKEGWQMLCGHHHALYNESELDHPHSCQWNYATPMQPIREAHEQRDPCYIDRGSQDAANGAVT